MTQTRHIIFVLYDGFELLDLGGLSGVFASANAIAGQPLYQVLCVSESGGLVASGVGVPVSSQTLLMRKTTSFAYSCNV